MSLTSIDDQERITLPCPLPEECIQLVFENLSQDLPTLHSLILVSKAFFRIATPFLYASPFALLEASEAGLGRSSQDRIRRHAALLYLLLNCCEKFSSMWHPPQELLPYVQPQQQQQQLEQITQHHTTGFWAGLPPVCQTFKRAHWRLEQPLVDYLGLYHDHRLGMNISTTFSILFPNIQRYSTLVSHAMASTKNPAAKTTITTFTRNEIEKRFLLYRPALVRAVSIPIQRFAAFCTTLDHLSGLVRLELLGISWEFDLSMVISFIDQHYDRYNSLREFKLTGPNDARVIQKPALHDMVKAFRCPREIDLSRYKEASRDLNTFELQNVSGIRKLLFSLDYVPPITATTTSTVATTTAMSTRGQPDVPHEDCCLEAIKALTSLEHLQIGINSGNAFVWALERSRSASDWSLPPLETLHISANSTAVAMQALADGLRAFQHTLRDVTAISLKLSPAAQTSSLLPNPSFGWYWPLKNLTTLHLKGELAVWFDMRSLEFCPRLQDLELTLYPFSPPDPEHVARVVIAPGLKRLCLVGRWNISDNVLARLGEGLPLLRRLVLHRCQCDGLTAGGLQTGLNRMLRLQVVEAALEEPNLELALHEYREKRPTLKIVDYTELQRADVHVTLQ
ncbi:hypothetical protein BGZ94_002299 [Podila epigama]|nr:hypothetical protein BGZ94_002299 [Podila epigama]